MSKVTETLRAALKNAREYVGMVGKEQPHLSSSGYIHALSVSTEIHYQASPGTNNYWKDAAFDGALSRVVKRRFAELAAEALAEIEGAWKESFIAEKQELLARLAKIEELEREQS